MVVMVVMVVMVEAHVHVVCQRAAAEKRAGLGRSV